MNRKAKTPPQDPNDEKKRQESWRRQVKFGLSYLVASLIGLWLFQEFILAPLANQATEIPYSEFKTKLKAGEISAVTLTDTRIVGEMKNPGAGGQNGQTVPFTTVAVPNGDPKLIEALDAAGVKYQVEPPPSPLGQFLLAYGLPLALLAALWYIGYRGTAGNAARGMGSIFGVGKSKAVEVKPEQAGITYKDVGGCDEAIAELQETIHFLKAPGQFAQLGGRIPKGVLLIGPPGTGKTLLARATAGEAGVAFFEISGSEFVEMFVGVEAAWIAVMLGGRAAKKVALGSISTGASDDIQRATELARRMVTEFGMSDKLGTVRYAGQQLQYLGGMVSDDNQNSPQTRQAIDAEVQRIVGEQYERAQSLLTGHRAALESLTRQLLQSESLDGTAVKQALEAA